MRKFTYKPGRFWFIPVLFILIPAFTSAQQLERFSGDSTKFIGELNKIFDPLVANEKKMSLEAVKEFMLSWNAEKYSPYQKQLIYAIGNEMLAKRLKPFPDFYNYITSLNSFLDSHQPDYLFYEWTAILKKLIGKKNSRHFVQFVEQSISLFSENLIFKSFSTRWKIMNPDYHMIYDSVPLFNFRPTNLVCYANNDSLMINHTAGIYYPLTTRWVGKGGHVDWQRAGLDPSQVYANLGNYEIQMKYANFSADTVEFFNKKFFAFSLFGKYTDRVLADVTEDKASYPTFYSYDKTIGINNLFKNVDFLGGFAMEGSKILGTGSNTANARLIFRKNGKDFIRIYSKLFVIHPDRINSAQASITLYHDDDSLYNPVLQMKYIDEKKELTLSRDERISTISPWFDSWHNIEIYCESLSWKLYENKVNFEMMKGPNQEGHAVFESANYFSAQRYDKLQGVDEYNPLFIIRKFSEKYKTRNFTLDQLVTFMEKPPEQVEAQLLTLAYKGFLFYDPEEKKGRIKDKLINYVKANDGKVDYDVIFFNSTVTAKSNGILSLDSFDLVIQGVPKVYLSDSQQVYIYPSKEQVILKKDGDFLFSGKVEAGLFDFYTNGSSFEYKRFRLDLPVVDSMAVYVRSRTKDPKTQTYPFVKVRTYITSLSGDLLIDDPKNKSGLKKHPEYPIFTSKHVSFVNWDKKTVQNGVYKKSKFFYSVDPFTFKSMGNFQTDSLKFKGSLVSAGIFPDLKEPLTVRPDYSFGIETHTDSTGLPAYGGKGRFISKIEMSNEGLRGDGQLIFMNSTSFSKDFVFFPDSMKTLAKSVTITETTVPFESPSAQGDSVREFWRPYKDFLHMTSTAKDISMYNNQSAFSGRLTLTPLALTGKGTVKILDSEMDAFLYVFKRRMFDATIANFRVKSGLVGLSISTVNYQTHIDFDRRIGEFKSNHGISKVEFPINKYLCTMDRFDWLMDKKEIMLYNERNKQLDIADTLSADKLVDYAFPGSEFVSTHPAQDSLRFFALKAKYSLYDNVIDAEDVKVIRVSDAAIFPDSGKVHIMREAQMKSLRRAGIIANTTNKFHHFYNCNVNILSRKKYGANGYYDYVERNGEKQQIRFTMIGVDPEGQTVAQGTGVDTAKFMLSPEFAFKGDINLRASQRNLIFDGYFKPVTDCRKTIASWTLFKSDITAAHVTIPLNDPLVDDHRHKLGLGLMFSNTGGRIYSAFFVPKESFSDSLLVSATGMIDFDPAAGAFRITDMDRRKDPTIPGNLLTLSVADCILHGGGKLSMGVNPGALRMEAYGSMDHFIIPDSTKARLAVAFDFPFSEDAMAKFSAQLNSINLSGIVFSSSPYIEAMKMLLSKKDFDKAKTEMETVGKLKHFPDELNRTFFLADVRFIWDTAGKAWVSNGPIGIGCIGKTQVNKFVNGLIEFQKKRGGDEFNIYFEVTKNDWYYFNYRNNLVMALSSNLEFNDKVEAGTKSSAEMKRIGNIIKNFRYTIATERKKREFLRRYNYSGQ